MFEFKEQKQWLKMNYFIHLFGLGFYLHENNI
jgi:hypothetical protein